MKYLYTLLTFLLLSSTVHAEDTAKTGYYTVHTFTTHFHVEGLETFTPGIAYTNENGTRFGVLRNSYKLPSLYVAKTIDFHSWLRIGVGLATGYTIQNGRIEGKRTGIIPFPAIEVDITNNLSVLWMADAINLELKFK